MKPKLKGLVYLAGPMRGVRFFNFPAFDEARDRLRQEGWSVISPADLDREMGFDETQHPEDYDWLDLGKIGFDLHGAVDRDVDALKRCTAIYMLDGWEKSRGALAEKHLAEWLGLEIMYEVEPPSEDVLEEALRITGGDRMEDYGHPRADLTRIAGMWSALKGVQFGAKEVAMFMVCVKLSREAHRPKRDNWVDMAGWARCGFMCEDKIK